MQHNCLYTAGIYVGETKQRQSETSPKNQYIGIAEGRLYTLLKINLATTFVHASTKCKGDMISIKMVMKSDGSLEK